MKTVEQEIEDAKRLATDRCVAAGGNRETIEVVEIDVVPVSYTTNATTRILVRVVGELVEGSEEILDSASLPGEEISSEEHAILLPPAKVAGEISTPSKGSSYEVLQQLNHETYRPRIEGDLWYLSEVDLQYLQDGTGVLGVGSCGEPYPAYLACLLALRNGGDLIIRRQSTFPDDGIVLVSGFMVGYFPTGTVLLN